jgi:hypothetical protein
MHVSALVAIFRYLVQSLSPFLLNLHIFQRQMLKFRLKYDCVVILCKIGAGHVTAV